MPAGELYIKYNSEWTGISASSRYNYNSTYGTFSQSNSGTWVDMFKEWGVSFDSTGLSMLMTPAPLKPMIENSVATEHGTRVVRDGRKLESRSITLGFNIVASTKANFFLKYGKFCTQVLGYGKLDLMSAYQAGTVYHLDYLSCQSFGEYQREIGKFSLRVVEPNPGNRTDS